MLLEKSTQITIMGKWRITKLCNWAGSLNIRYLYFSPVRGLQYCRCFRCKINKAKKTKMAQNVGAIYFLYLKKMYLNSSCGFKRKWFSVCKEKRTKMKSTNPSFPSTVNKLFFNSTHSWDKTNESNAKTSSECSHREYLQVLCTGWLDRGLFEKSPR